MSDDTRIVELRSLGARIGRNVFFGPDVYIERDFAPLLLIEDGVVLARGSCVLLHDSALNNVAGEPLKFGQVTLRENCYIGANTTIVCGVEVGAGAIVGACSLVTMDIPAGTVAYGHPARVQSNVESLIAKHRELSKRDQRYYYLDLKPWRDRRGWPEDMQAGENIAAFLRQIVASDGQD